MFMEMENGPSLNDLTVPFGVWCEKHDLTHKECPICGECCTFEDEHLSDSGAAESAYFAHMEDKHPDQIMSVQDRWNLNQS